MYPHRHSGTDGFALLSSTESSEEGVAAHVPPPCSHAAVGRRKYASHRAIFEHPVARTALQRRKMTEAVVERHLQDAEHD